MFKSKTTLSHDFPPFTSGSLRYIQGLGILSYRILSTNAWHRSVMSGPKLWLLKIHWHWGSFWIHSLFKQGSWVMTPELHYHFFWYMDSPHVYMSWNHTLCYFAGRFGLRLHDLYLRHLRILSRSDLCNFWKTKSCPSCQGSKHEKSCHAHSIHVWYI